MVISNKVSLEFLEIALTALELGRYRIISAQPSISQTTILSLSIPVPEVDFQRELVEQVNELRKVILAKRKSANQITTKAKSKFNHSIFD